MTVTPQAPKWNGKLIGIPSEIFFQFFGLGRCYFKTSHSHSLHNSNGGLDPYFTSPIILTIPPPNSHSHTNSRTGLTRNKLPETTGPCNVPLAGLQGSLGTRYNVKGFGYISTLNAFTKGFTETLPYPLAAKVMARRAKCRVKVIFNIHSQKRTI